MINNKHLYKYLIALNAIALANKQWIHQNGPAENGPAKNGPAPQIWHCTSDGMSSLRAEQRGKMKVDDKLITDHNSELKNFEITN